ncbi:MAG: peptidylprolyl isomerase [Caldilineaceae bacterium]|nr:peptidylprolyl isomerase [Caldilineaceae bacterium]
MAKRKKRAEEQVERELTRKEIRLRERDRERHRVLYLWIGSAIGLALLLIIAGAIYQFAFVPNSTLATVAGERIITKDFWQRMRLERNQLQNQLLNLQQLEQQFGQQFFTSQINDIQTQLQSPFTLAARVLDKMVDERVVAKEAAARGITVSDEEVDAALREEIARGRNAVTEPEATSTADGALNATATATLWTPTPTPTIDASLATTATATAMPTSPPLPTSAILSPTGYTEGVTQLEENLGALNSVDLAGYRAIIRARLLTEKMTEAIGEEKVPATEEQVRARHILIRVMTPTVTITDTGTITAPILPPSTAVTDTAAATTTTTVSETAPVTATVAVTDSTSLTTTPVVTTAVETTTTAPVTAAVSDSPVITAGVSVTESVAVTAESGITTTAAITDTLAPTTTTTPTDTVPPVAPTPVERTDAEALALAEAIRQRILAGEDFATLAREYSDDTGSGAAGGDLGWFGKGAMVAPFDEVAFSLPIGEISEPVKTDFGYHIIEVLEKDENHAKDPNQLTQERQEAYQTWLREVKTATAIDRPTNLTTLLPRDLR